MATQRDLLTVLLCNKQCYIIRCQRLCETTERLNERTFRINVNGVIYRRNRVHIKPFKGSFQPEAASPTSSQPHATNPDYGLNPTVSQPMLIGSEGLLAITNYSAQRRTIVILHGWGDSATSAVVSTLVPAFLFAEDVNVVVPDWSVGSSTSNYLAAVSNAVASGESVARFVNWLTSATGTSAQSYHILGQGMGAHQAGVVGRNVHGSVAYITGLDPDGPGWIFNSNRFHEDDGEYTEVIHTNAGAQGYLATLAKADFYPNGGLSMPGCNSQSCDHDRSFHYMAESLRTGGFTGRRCATYIGATTGFCILWGNLNMGGIHPKTGSSGIFWLQTNAGPPFSQN